MSHAPRIPLLVIAVTTIAAGCASEPALDTAAAPVVAYCEPQEVEAAGPILIPVGVENVGGSLAAWSGLIIAGGVDLAADNGVHGVVSGFYRGIGVPWQPLELTPYTELDGGELGDAYPIVEGTPALAFNNDELGLAAIAYVHRKSLPPFAYQVVLDLVSVNEFNTLTFQRVVMASGTAAIGPRGEVQAPAVAVAIDGTRAVVGWSWIGQAAGPGGLPDGGAAVYDYLDIPPFPGVVIPLVPPSAGPGFGDDVALRDGRVAVARSGAAPSVALYHVADDFLIATTVATGEDDPSRVRVGLDDDARLVIAHRALDGVAAVVPIQVYADGGAGYAPVATLPTNPGSDPRISSLSIYADRIAVGTAGFSVRVYHRESAAPDYALELERFGGDQAEAVVALGYDDEQVVVGRRAALDGSINHIEVWPFAQLEAVDDAYAAAPGTLLVTVASTGVMANDALHCVVPDVVIDAPPKYGSLVMDLDGSFGYLPGVFARFACGDRFRYHLEDVASISDEATATISITGSECRRFQWNAYSEKPYIYKGCPDPGPEPGWANVPVIAAAQAGQHVEVDLGSDVPLQIDVVTAPRNGDIVTTDTGFAFVPTGAAGRDHVALRVTAGSCTYALDAELVIER